MTPRTQAEIDAESLRDGKDRGAALKIEFTPGLPPPLTGACIFLMWDGSLCEGVLHREGEHLMLTHYNLTAPSAPEKITVRADTGKVQGYTPISGHASAAA